MDTPIARAVTVKDWAAQEHFDACGIADATQPIDPTRRLHAWLDAGYHADMRWMESSAALREDQRQRFPEMRSAVVLARSYYAPRPETSCPSAGLISSYAWGRDYHRALKKPLERLARRIETLELDATTYISVDSGPVLEKAWAVRAGLGWRGKNSLILREGIGSCFFIGVIFTTVELTPDPPLPDQCGACRACINACPTGAIVEPGVVDSRRCISYHAIENRSIIPVEIAGAMGRWVFGCDLCQTICPWNRGLSVTTETDFHPRPGRANPDLHDLREMDAQTFLDRFQGSPVMRAKAEGIRRNAAICLQNLQEETE